MFKMLKHETSNKKTIQSDFMEWTYLFKVFQGYEEDAFYQHHTEYEPFARSQCHTDYSM
jgi:hypothetical protein